MSSERCVQVLDGELNTYSVIKKITELPNQEDPFYVCDVSKLIWLYNNWKALLPRVEFFYAMKCNDYKLVLETFAAIGSGFDCASDEEIRKILALNVHPDKIIFANPTKLIHHIEYAAKVGVKTMTFDSLEELNKIKKHHPEAELLIRIRCDDVSAKYVLGKKFGALPTEDSLDLLKVAKSLNLNVIGVAFHVGSGCMNYGIYYEAIAAARKVFDMGRELGFKFQILDIGGGYPGDSKKPLNQIADLINRGLNEYFPDNSIRVIAEPGKYAVNTAFKLVTQINSKNIIRSIKGDIRMYYVDVSVYNSMINVLFNDYYDCRPVNEMDNEKLHPSIIWGPTHESNDRLSETYHYLPDLKIGDWVILEEIGGYSLCISCGYNGFPIPNVCGVVNKKDWLLLAETVTNPVPKIRFTTSIEYFLKNLELSSYTFTRYF
ncbi:ornithine decarboxylase-like isoform X1 [Diorhabda sublineata]|uniref:ornithine decarboxylase-like isoform X1 n=1 Tax=Diorhabda sublineata TaxID=1163346 RepID=UPI0024E06B0A|nr:ornithine decarboxylase-like isoform X1 [Diorhabda sublineata]